MTPLETNLQAILGNTKAIDTVKPCVICTISFDSRMPQVWETGIPRPKVVNGEIDPASDRFGLKNTEMWRVCRATSAAPTYFKPAAVRTLPVVFFTCPRLSVINSIAIEMLSPDGIGRCMHVMLHVISSSSSDYVCMCLNLHLACLVVS